MECSNRHDLDIVRGDSKEIWVGLARGWDDVGLDPSEFEGRLVFRERQDDDYPELLSITTTPEPATDHRFPDMDYIMNLSLTPQQTQDLPHYPLVCFCELRKTDGSFVKRLFNGKIKHKD